MGGGKLSTEAEANESVLIADGVELGVAHMRWVGWAGLSGGVAKRRMRELKNMRSGR